MSKKTRQKTQPQSLVGTKSSPHAPAKSGIGLKDVFISVALVLVSLIIYGQTLGFDFINYDDDQYVFKNEMLKSGLSKHGIWWAFTTFFYANWHPLTWISYMVDYQFWGLKPSGYHFTNLVLHCGAVLLIYIVLNRMTKAAWRSAIVAMLFAVHPLHVESVAWVSERKDVLCAFFGMLALWAYARYVRCEGQKAKWKYYCLVLLFFALGLLSKPMLVTLPFAMLLLDYWPLARVQGLSSSGLRQWRSLILEKLPLIALSAADSVLTVLAQRGGGAITGINRMPFEYRVSNAAIAYVGYLEKMIWPLDLGVLYPLKPALRLWSILPAVGLLVLVTLAVALQTKRRPYLIIGWLWFLGTLVPVIGLVQVGAQSMADRYAYLPSIGLFVAAVWWIADLVSGSKSWQRVVAVGTAVVILALAVCAQIQTAYWHDSISLFKRTLAVTSNNFTIHNNLGYTLAKAGKNEEAIFHCQEALRIVPDYGAAHENLAIALTSQNRFAEAIDHYRSALRINPSNPGNLNNLGVLLFQRGDVDGAITNFMEAVHLNPNDALANNNVGFMLAQQSRYAEAIPYYSKSIALDPNYETARKNLEAARRAMDSKK